MYLVNWQKDTDSKQYNIDYYIRQLCDILKKSHIPFDILEENGNYFIFPKGAEELDNAVISEPLVWIEEHPPFIQGICQST